ncbi:YraN family protein [Microbacterium sp. NC79]|uniref:YraN family protein n=1 Tax=Microbacterium sp. NC79 TaxID=2851009 RepID=UPI001C2C37CB|nr:YraN family protein [Microbacterium sp. NC79]MBV0894682.1 YraN family protein [Microbacterium sp. NC79]
MAAKDDLGRRGEQLAVEYLTERNHVVVDRNWRCAEGELDVVTVSGDMVVVVEVKTRRSMAFGDPLEAVDARKRSRLWRLARAWGVAHPEILRGRSVRLDIIGITGGESTGFDLAHLEDVR